VRPLLINAHGCITPGGERAVLYRWRFPAHCSVAKTLSHHLWHCSQYNSIPCELPRDGLMRDYRSSETLTEDLQCPRAIRIVLYMEYTFLPPHFHNNPLSMAIVLTQRFFYEVVETRRDSTLQSVHRVLYAKLLWPPPSPLTNYAENYCRHNVGLICMQPTLSQALQGSL
jgi:hypothetical protein